MTIHKATDDVTAAGSAGNVNIRPGPGNTADRVDIESDADTVIEPESSGVTSGETPRRLLKSGGSVREGDTLKAKFRASQASALFDPEAMALLESLSKKPSFNFEELAEKIPDPVEWIKLAVLVRAYLVEPLDNGVRVTPEGFQALETVNNYLSRLDVKDQEIGLGKVQ